MARALTVTAHPSGVYGAWQICHNKTVLAVLIQPNAQLIMGQDPTRSEIIEAVQEIAPAYGATSQTPIRFQGVDL